jgi:hypothetical protein
MTLVEELTFYSIDWRLERPPPLKPPDFLGTCLFGCKIPDINRLELVYVVRSGKAPPPCGIT